MKRLGIYFFFDKDGIVDKYIDYVLEDLTKHVDKLIVVCNGQLNERGRKTFEKFTGNIIVRENKGFDVWAYKTAIDSEGWNKLIEYDEIILMNYTIMGPVYPLKEMFDIMDKRLELDFWGITKCFQENSPVAQQSGSALMDIFQNIFSLALWLLEEVLFHPLFFRNIGMKCL